MTPTDRPSRVLPVRGIAIILVVLAATAAAWWFTRAPVAAAAQPGHDHAAMLRGDSGGSPVMLTPDQERRIGVTYATVERGALAADVRTVGLVTYDETKLRTIAPKIDGWIEELFVAYTGQAVKGGDPLLRIYSPMLVTAQEELLLARKLAADVGPVGGDAGQRANALLAAARQRLRYWDVPDDEIARVESTGVVSKTLTLRSPIAGVAIRRNVLAGQRLMAGDAAFQVADLGEVWLEGEIFERDLSAIRLGQHVTADFDALPGESRAGRIVFISPTVANDTRTVQIRVALPNPGYALKPGMYATIHVRGTPATNVVNVPRSAVLVTGTRTLAFVQGADGMLTPREVETGATTDDRVEIRRGLAPGETVVASATFLIDAESNLANAMAGMAGMPGMDMSAPAMPATPPGRGKIAEPMPDMPGMPATPPTKKP